MISSDGDFITFYAPFDYINPVAKIVICGLTPGLQQATNALNTLMSSLQSGDSDELALRRAKEVASFSGPMRSNLIAMLDHVGIHHVLGIDSCADLFGSKSHLVHYTSALRNPVFKDGVNYSGAPSMIKQPMLLRQIEEVLAEEIRSLAPDCLYVPLGDEVSKAFLHLESKGIIDAAAVFHGFPHPSPASNERIHYFLGRKERHLLSSKTNPEKIDSNKQSIISKVNAISASKVTNRLHDIA
jgi:hypothetical protein